MNINDHIARELPFLRQQAESMMTLALTPQIPGEPTVDADGYEVTPYAAQTPHPGKVQGGSQAGKDGPTRYVKVGGIERPVLTAGLHIPVGAPVPRPSEQRGIGWEYVVTTIGPIDDPSLLGRRYLVVGTPAKSFATARRLDVVEIDPEPADTSTITYTFDTDGDAEGWVPFGDEGTTVDAIGGRLIAVLGTGGGGAYVEAPVAGATITAALSIAADAELDLVYVQLDDRVAQVANANVPVSGVDNPTPVTVGPIDLTGTSFRLSVSGSYVGGEQIAVDNVTLTITGG